MSGDAEQLALPAHRQLSKVAVDEHAAIRALIFRTSSLKIPLDD
ncbi:hypothetical protein [Bradyrhizobium hipponense]|nr:hypothetical protein [Bradyrhizobium hipponense]